MNSPTTSQRVWVASTNSDMLTRDILEAVEQLLPSVTIEGGNSRVVYIRNFKQADLDKLDGAYYSDAQLIWGYTYEIR